MNKHLELPLEGSTPVPFKVTSATIEPIENNQPPPPIPYVIDSEKILTIDDVRLFFKAAGLYIYDDNPHFEEMRYLLVDGGIPDAE